MQLTFLGSESNNGGSPTLFGTDRGTYLIQGWKAYPQAVVAFDLGESVGKDTPPCA